MTHPLSFDRGESAILVTRAPNGAESHETVKVKEMAGKRNAAIETRHGSRMVNIKQLRKLEQAEKIQTPPSFAPSDAAVADQKEIGVVLRGARNSRNLSLELFALLLRIDTDELTQFEAGREIPTDDVVLRLADVLSLPLDPVIAALEHSRAKQRRKQDEQEQLEREAKKQREEAQRQLEERKKLEDQQREQTKAKLKSFEVFCEDLMDLVAVPLHRDQRKQWYVFARAIFDLKDQEK